jgi:long-chain acyl-CoA synthetase
MAPRDPDEDPDIVQQYEERYVDEVAELKKAEHRYTDEYMRMETLPRMFEHSASQHADLPAQQYKGGLYPRSLVEVGAIDAAPDGEFASLSYAEMQGIVSRLALGFRALGIEPGDRVGIFSDSRMEWAHSDFALMGAGAVVTTVYKSSSPGQVQYLLDDPGAVGVVVENAELIDRVLEVVDSLDVRFIISIDELNEEHADTEGVYSLGTVYEQGDERYDPDRYEGMLDEVEVDELASIIYTSGTTGKPKGVKLTHRNLRSNLNQGYVRVTDHPGRGSDQVLDADDVTLSYLPLAHVFERNVGHYMPFNVGATVSYAESVDTLTEDFEKVQPTVATSVPRVYEKIYDGIRDEAEKKEIAGVQVGERIFEWAVEVARNYQKESKPSTGLRMKHWLADKLVYSDVKEGLGGNVELLVSGGGTLSPDLARLYRGMNLPLVEGYGLTETSPNTSIYPLEFPQIGTLGVPLEGVDVRIDESVAPEGQFDDATGKFGELQIAGPNVTDGYWEMPEKTESSFTDDGYFRTGDIVQRRPDGYLVFRERSKQILVLSTGKNVAPSPVEDAFTDSDVVDQVMVIGDGEKFTGALIVPDFDRVRVAADRQGIEVPEDPEEMCGDENVRAAVQNEVDSVNARFETHETIKQFRLVPEEWTEENDMLTPSQKKKRPDILERYADLVEEIYSDDGGDTVSEDESTSQSPEPAD